jgi:hypothetical protein
VLAVEMRRDQDDWLRVTRRGFFVGKAATGMAWRAWAWI